MKSTIKITTGTTILTAGIACFMVLLHKGVFDFGTYGIVGGMITIFLLLGSVTMLLLIPHPVNTTLFGVVTGVMLYMTMSGKATQNLQLLAFNMIICFFGIFLIVNGINSLD